MHSHRVLFPLSVGTDVVMMKAVRVTCCVTMLPMLGREGWGSACRMKRVVSLVLTGRITLSVPVLRSGSVQLSRTQPSRALQTKNALFVLGNHFCMEVVGLKGGLVRVCAYLRLNEFNDQQVDALCVGNVRATVHETGVGLRRRDRKAWWTGLAWRGSTWSAGRLTPVRKTDWVWFEQPCSSEAELSHTQTHAL